MSQENPNVLNQVSLSDTCKNRNIHQTSGITHHHTSWIPKKHRPESRNMKKFNHIESSAKVRWHRSSTCLRRSCGVFFFCCGSIAKRTRMEIRKLHVFVKDYHQSNPTQNPFLKKNIGKHKQLHLNQLFPILSAKKVLCFFSKGFKMMGRSDPKITSNSSHR